MGPLKWKTKVSPTHKKKLIPVEFVFHCVITRVLPIGKHGNTLINSNYCSPGAVIWSSGFWNALNEAEALL